MATHGHDSHAHAHGHAHHGSDKGAAFVGLFGGLLFIMAVCYAIVQWTNTRFAGHSAGAAGSPPAAEAKH